MSRVLGVLTLVLVSGLALSSEVVDRIEFLRTQTGDYDGAIELAREFLDGHTELDRERERVQYELGLSLNCAGRPKEALGVLGRLILDYDEYLASELPEDTLVDDARYWIATIELLRGDRARAIRSYRTTIEKHLWSNCRAAAMVVLAGIDRKDGRLHRSCALYRALLEQYPGTPHAVAAAHSLEAMRQADPSVGAGLAAYADAAGGCALDAHAPAALLFAARMLAERDSLLADAVRPANGECVRACVGAVLHYHPGCEEAPKAVAVLMRLHSGRFAWRHVHEVACAIVSLFPTSREAQLAKLEAAWLIADRSDPENKSSECARALDLVHAVLVEGMRAEDFDFYEQAICLRISVLIEQGSHADARELCRWFLKQYGDRVTRLEHLVTAVPYSYFMAGDHATALKEFERLLEEYPDARDNWVPFWKYWIARCHLESGDDQQAEKAVQRLMKDHPDARGAHAARAHLQLPSSADRPADEASSSEPVPADEKTEAKE